jgi:hypothetical protein
MGKTHDPDPTRGADELIELEIESYGILLADESRRIVEDQSGIVLKKVTGGVALLSAGGGGHLANGKFAGQALIVGHLQKVGCNRRLPVEILFQQVPVCLLCLGPQYSNRQQANDQWNALIHCFHGMAVKHLPFKYTIKRERSQGTTFYLCIFT